MKYGKKIAITTGVIGVLGAAGAGGAALAATNSSSSYPPIVNRIASTFNLNPAKVNDIFLQQKQQNQTERQAHLRAVLDQAVKDGKLTQAQETKLLAELQTLHNQVQGPGAGPGIKTQLEQWAQANGITNLDQILPSPQGEMHRHGANF